MEVLHDEEAHRFTIALENNLQAFVEYRRMDGAIDLCHTYVSPETRERGLAEKVVEAAFRYAQKNNLQVIPSCSYVSGRFLQKRTEFLSLVRNP